ncbi:MAG TPA: threonine synthase [Syntrophomonadaceae bacterium]|nr:threonine synthase [Syntrophomonadaceae bacterium]HQE23672.1 threonine synthase [Syntrophomonadaceae bacterium]
MLYFSSRGKTDPVSAAQAITMGIAADGGLFVPEILPRLNEEDWLQLQKSNYQQRAAHILRPFLPEFTQDELNKCVNAAYHSKRFDDPQIAPLVKLHDQVFIQELWHGPTCAFKDMALQMLPHLLTLSMAKTEEAGDIVILVATSGDTGKAALEGFKDVDRTRIIVFYPDEGVSEVQKRQMVTQEGSNVFVAAVAGNFDDAQSGVKRIFGNPSFNNHLADHGLKLSSANSINWGRLVPQIVYYVSAYVDLLGQGVVEAGQPVNFVVPTGNFGNILGAYYAGMMGVPINRLICASNANNVLTDFIRTGIYDRNRRFEKTLSPSMDILISSNLERLLFEITGHDAGKVSVWMEQLKNQGRYEIDPETKNKVQSIFWADYCNDDQTLMTIRAVWEEWRYLLDTHTAVAVQVYQNYQKETADSTPTAIMSTASPFKFGSSVAQALFSPELIQGKDEFTLLNMLSTATGIQIPKGIEGLENREIRHKTRTKAEDMEQTVLDFLQL